MTISKYDSTGKYLFVSDKDSKCITLIDGNTNLLMGTYVGHNGVIWSLDVTCDSKILISVSGDMTFIVWDIETGDIINKIDTTGIGKNVSIQQGKLDSLIAIGCDAIGRKGVPCVDVYSLKTCLTDTSKIEPLFKIVDDTGIKITSLLWVDDYLVVGYDSGVIKKFDDMGNLMHSFQPHKASVKSLSLNYRKTRLITGSTDKKSIIFELPGFETKQYFMSKAPINCSIFSTDEKYVILGGGTELMLVAKTGDNDLSTKIFSVETGKIVKQMTSHFGPVRYLNFNPNNKSFVSAGQDGFVKIYKVNDKLSSFIAIIMDTTIHFKSFGTWLEIGVEERELKDEIIKMDTLLNKKQKKIKIIEYPIGHDKYVRPDSNFGLFKSEYKMCNKKEEIEEELETDLFVSTIKKKTVYKNNGIKISNLPEDIEIDELFELFEFCGRIEEKGINIIYRDFGNIAFITYLDDDGASNAIIKLNNFKIRHCVLCVKLNNNTK